VSDEQPPLDELAELNRELRVREHDRLYSILEKTEEATIKSAEGVIRILLLISGGGAVSLLAFVGSLVSKDRITAAPQLNAIAESLIPFALGVACAAICALFFYLTNLSYLFATWRACANRLFHTLCQRLNPSLGIVLGEYFIVLRC
jgi:hypothetical protein